MATHAETTKAATTENVGKFTIQWHGSTDGPFETYYGTVASPLDYTSGEKGAVRKILQYYDSVLNNVVNNDVITFVKGDEHFPDNAHATSDYVYMGVEANEYQPIQSLSQVGRFYDNYHTLALHEFHHTVFFRQLGIGSGQGLLDLVDINYSTGEVTFNATPLTPHGREIMSYVYDGRGNNLVDGRQVIFYGEYNDPTGKAFDLSDSLFGWYAYGLKPGGEVEKLMPAGHRYGWEMPAGIPLLGHNGYITFTPEGEIEEIVGLENMLEHSGIPTSVMSYGAYRNIPFLLEVELALLQDIGYSIDRSKHFGKSYYMDGTTATNSNAFGTAANPNTMMYGLGLHVAADSTAITQTGSIFANGEGGGGIRIDGSGNTVTIAQGTQVRADGINGIGLLGSIGSNNNIVLRGTLSGDGKDGYGARFDTGDSYGWVASHMDPYQREIESRYDLEASELCRQMGGAMVNDFDISGSISGSKAAIYIAENAHVERINFLRGANVNGDIISDYTAGDRTTLLSFGKNTTANGTAGNGADNNFDFQHFGNIEGRFDLATYGGTTILAGDVDVLSGTVSQGGGASSLILSGNANFLNDLIVKQHGELGVFGTVSVGGNVVMEDGSMLSIDLVNASATIGGTARMGLIDLNLASLHPGTYTLHASGGFYFDDPNIVNAILVDGVNIESIARASEMDITPYLMNDGKDLQLSISGDLQNLALTWTGTANNIWDLASENWSGDDTRFFDGDAATFSGTTGAVITVSGAGKTVADMTVNGNGNWTFNGNIIGDAGASTLPDATGRLMKAGNGTLTLNGNNDFKGGTTVAGGTLIVGNSAGTSASLFGNVNVHGNATLGGHGTIGGQLVLKNGATLSPGTSIGRLEVEGGAVFEAGSTYLYEIENGVGDELVVTGGTVSIDGEAKLLIDVSGTRPKNEQEFTVIELQNGAVFEDNTEFQPVGTWAGRFEHNVVQNIGYFVTYLFTDPEFALNVAPYATRNAYNAAVAMDTIHELGRTDRIAPLYDALADMDASNPRALAAAFAQLHGEVFASNKIAAARMQRQFVNHLPSACDGITNSQRGFLGQCGSPQSSWNRWAAFSGDWLNRANLGTYSGYDLRAAGVAVGMDRKISQRAFVGAAFGYDNAYQNFRTINSADQMDAFRMMLYGGLRNKNSYADGYIGYTNDRHKTRRDVNIDNGAFCATARSSYNDDLFSTGFELGQKLPLLTPSIGLHYVRLSSPNVTETGGGAANLYVHSGHYDSLQIPVGAKLSRERRSLNGIVWTPEVRAFYLREFCDDSVHVRTSLAGVGFLADSGKWGRNSGRLGVGLGVQLADRLNFRVDYDYEIHDHTNVNAWATTLGVKW